MKNLLILLLLLSCGRTPTPAPDLHGPYKCASLPYLGRWVGADKENGLYLDKDCWGTIRSCNYFFTFDPPTPQGDTVMNIKVTEGGASCLPKGEALGTIKQYGEELDIRLGDYLLHFKRE